MAMMAYRASMFMIFFNYGMMIANYISTLIFPGNSVAADTLSGSIIPSAAAGMIVTLALTAGTLGLFAFSLLIPTIPFVMAFFLLSGVITEIYVDQLPIPIEFKTPLFAGVAIIYYAGLAQYSAKSTFQGS